MMNFIAAVSASGTSNWLPGALLAAGVLAVTLVSMRIWLRNRRKARAISEGPSARERLNEMSLVKQRDSIESLIVDLQETARTCAAQVENRAARLEALMRQTDQKVLELKEALKHADSRRSQPAPVVRAVEPAEQPQQRFRLETERDSRTQRILGLHGEGASDADIARELGEEIGKVQLILSLHAARTGGRATA